MSLLADIVRNHEELIAIRRDIHAHPELAFREQRTSALVAYACITGRHDEIDG